MKTRHPLARAKPLRMLPFLRYRTKETARESAGSGDRSQSAPKLFENRILMRDEIPRSCERGHVEAHSGWTEATLNSNDSALM
jgi:hypothetical protein